MLMAMLPLFCTSENKTGQSRTDLSYLWTVTSKAGKGFIFHGFIFLFNIQGKYLEIQEHFQLLPDKWMEFSFARCCTYYA